MTTTMLAAVYHANQGLQLEKVPIPATGPDGVLIRVENASICGTDLRIVHGQHRKYPPGTVRIPGHEMVGVIAEVGGHIPELSKGQRVFIAPNWGCGHCKQCISGQNNLCVHYQAIGVTIDGAFAEYVRIPAEAVQQGNIIPLNEGVDPFVAALAEPFACVLRGQNAVGIRPGEVVVVMGAGPIGLMHLKLAHLRGAGKVVMSEPNPDRLNYAIHLGIDRAVNPSKDDLRTILDTETHGRGADVVIVAAPSRQAQELAVLIAGIGGRINFFGGLPKENSIVAVDGNLVHYKELVLTGTTACSTSDCWQAAEIVNSGRIDLSDLVTGKFPLAQVEQAFKAAEDGKSLKVVIQP